jgi:superfamily II DNA helicase RecQ
MLTAPLCAFLKQDIMPSIPPSTKFTKATLLKLLRQGLNSPNAEFRCKTQESMLQLAADRQKNFIAILGTGGGKSIVWDVLSTTIETHKTTLVVAPYFALVADQIATRQAQGRSVGKWTATQAGKWAKTPSIVYVIPEAIDSARAQFKV